MTLQAASTTKTSSAGVALDERSVIDSLIMTDIIEAKIKTESTATGRDEETTKITIDIDADINGRTKPVELIQSDNSRILLEDVIKAFSDAGYRSSFKAIKTRTGKNDKVKLQIAW